MKFRPLHDRVLVETVEAETVTSGGIILPETSQEKPQKAHVLSVGSGYINENGDVRVLDVKAGDMVMYAQWSGTEVKIDGKDYLILKESDIIGVIEE